MGVLVCDAGDPSLDEVPIFEVGERKGMGWLLCFIVFWIGLYWFGLVCIGLYWFVLVCIGLYWFVLVCIGLYWFVLVCIDLF